MKIINLQKSFDNFKLNIENFQPKSSLIHGIIGSNGCGKSTFLKSINGLIKCDKRNIDFQGLKEREITYISQRPYMMHDTVLNNLIYPLKIRKEKVKQNIIEDELSKFGLLEKADQNALSLSGGEQQKLSFARALIFKPKLICMDETFANLDPDSVSLICNIILETQKKEPVTWLIVSHQLVHIKTLCQQVHFMSHGEIIKSDETSAFFNEPSNPQIVKYIHENAVIL